MTQGMGARGGGGGGKRRSKRGVWGVLPVQQNGTVASFFSFLPSSRKAHAKVKEKSEK